TNIIDEHHRLRMEIDKPGLAALLLEDYYDQPVFYDQPPTRQPVTVKQLEAWIGNGSSDAELARKLDGLQLTERLGSTKLAALAKSVHGKKSRDAFEVLADESAFLSLPADEIPAAPPPDIAAQHQMIARTVSYIKTTIPSLP